MILFQNLKKLNEKYGISVSDEYNDFILRTNMFDYTGKIIKVQNNEYEINHFLTESDCSSEDLFTWYLLSEPEYKDYLTIAFCIYDEEIAIKVRGADQGKIVLIIRDTIDENRISKIIDVSKKFSDFLKMIV